MKYRNKKKSQWAQAVQAEEGFHLESTQPTHTHAQGREGKVDTTPSTHTCASAF